MPLSAPKSTSNKREISASVAKQHSPVDYRKKNRFRRSKSVSAVTRCDVENPCALAGDDLSVAQFFNKRDNPLFCFSSISSMEHEACGDCCSSSSIRGRSGSRGIDFVNRTFESRNQSIRSLPRVGSEELLQAISKGHYDYYERETDGGQKEFLSLTNKSKDAYEPKFQMNKDASCSGYALLKRRKNLQRWSSRHPVSDYCNTSYSKSSEDGISIYSSSEFEETTVREAISRTNFTANIVEVGTENQDLLELVSDIRMEYEKMLKESHERARKLRADLAIEEQREQEINRMLREIMFDENSGPQKSGPWKTLSGEKLEMSRRLAEDAMSYFDECVSLSTFDGSDFTVDQQLNSIGIFSPLYESSSLASDASTFTTPYTLNDLLAHPEDVEIQSQCPVSVSGSNPAAISICSSSHDMSLPLNGQKHEKLSNKGRLLGGSIEISSACQAADNGESLNFRTYIKRFERKPNRGASNSEISSSFNINGYDLDNSAESRLLDALLLKNRTESGSLLLCDIRIF